MVQTAVCMRSHIRLQVHVVALCTTLSYGALAFPVCKQNWHPLWKIYKAKMQVMEWTFSREEEEKNTQAFQPFLSCLSWRNAVSIPAVKYIWIGGNFFAEFYRLWPTASKMTDSAESHLIFIAMPSNIHLAYIPLRITWQNYDAIRQSWTHSGNKS